MPGFLYFVDGATRPLSLEQLQAAGLGHAFETRPAQVVANKGPSGAPGVVIAGRGVETAALGYYPQRQRWAGCGLGASVGLDNSLPLPGPGDLLRPSPLRGHEVTLGDGNAWLIPVARATVDALEDALPYYCALPCASQLEEGEWVPGEVFPEYEELWGLALKWWDAIAGAVLDADSGSAMFDFGDMHSAAVKALAASYFIGAHEAALLRLLSGPHCRLILDALVDMPVVTRWLEKKDGAQGGSSSAPGRSDGFPTTTPASPT